MQVLLNHSFGRTFGYSYEIGGFDAKGLVIQAYVSNDQDGPHSCVYFG